MGSAEGFDGLRPQEAVSVGDHANVHELVSHWMLTLSRSALADRRACPGLAKGAAVAT